MSSLPAGMPIIIFCLDNSSFLAASEEGGLMPISKCVQEDDGYHVKGDLVVAPECALHHTLELLKKLVTELSEYQLFFVTPITRYIIGPCCNVDDHVTNSGNQDFLSKILSDLTKLKFSLRKKLAPATVLDGIELICGFGCNKDRIEQILRSGWADPVHPKPHIYSKMSSTSLRGWPPPAFPPEARRGRGAIPLRRDTLQELQARPREAARARTPDPRATGADPRSIRRRSPREAIELPTLATASNLTSLGILREAAASTRGEVRPEAVDTRSSEVLETGEGSRVAGGGGHGAAGNPAMEAGSTLPKVHPDSIVPF
jgi:hypothetical protein